MFGGGGLVNGAEETTSNNQGGVTTTEQALPETVGTTNNKIETATEEIKLEREVVDEAVKNKSLTIEETAN